MALKTTPYDPSRYLDSEEVMREYLLVTFEDGTPSEIAEALGVVARARGMTQLATDTGMSRPALYKALSGDGNPSFETIMKVMNALGVRLTVRPVTEKVA